MKQLLLLLILIISFDLIFGQSSGKIVGLVTDELSDKNLAGVTIELTNYYKSVETDSEGFYAFSFIPAGLYNLSFSYPGYKKMRVENITIKPNSNIEINIKMVPESFETLETVVLDAESYSDYSNLENYSYRISSDDIKNYPRRGAQNLIEILPGVVVYDNEVFIQGGRKDEVGYYINNSPVTDPLYSTNDIHVIPESIEDIQLLSGAYSAKYGRANSGIILTQLKTGTDNYSYSMNFQTDKLSNKGKKFLDTYSYRDHIITATASGPIFSKYFRFFIAVENEYIGDTKKRFSKGFSFPEKLISGSNWYDDPIEVAELNYPDGFTPGNNRNIWALCGTLVFDYYPFQLNLSGIYNKNKTYSTNRPMLEVLNNRKYWYDKDLFLLSGKTTHILSSKIHYDIHLSYLQNNEETFDDYFGNDWRLWGNGDAIVEYTDSAVVFPSKWEPLEPYNYDEFPIFQNGIPPEKYKIENKNYVNASLNFSAYLSRFFDIEFGLDFTQYTLRRFSVDPYIMSQVDRYGSEEAVPYYAAWKYLGNNFGYDNWGNKVESGVNKPKKPLFYSFYIQDRIRYDNLIFNMGIRYDYLDGKNQLLVDHYFPGEMADQKPVIDISPRLSMSYALNNKTVFYGQASKFIQTPCLNDSYENYNIKYLYYGRPVLIPIRDLPRSLRSIKYNFGIKTELLNKTLIDISYFHKNTNNEDWKTQGLQVKLDINRTKRIKANFHYTMSFNEGNTYYSLLSSTEPLYHSSWSSFNGVLNLDYQFGRNDGGTILEQSGINLIYKFNNNRPYISVQMNQDGVYPDPYYGAIQFDPEEIRASMRISPSPWIKTLDLQLYKTIDLIDNLQVTFYFRITNLLKTKNITNVYPLTGKSDDDGLKSIQSEIEYYYYYSEEYWKRYENFYKALNLENGQAYLDHTGREIYGHPRQILFGLKLNY